MVLLVHDPSESYRIALFTFRTLSRPHRLAQTLDDDHVGTNRVGRDAASGVIDYWSLSVSLFVCFTFSLFLLIER